MLRPDLQHLRNRLAHLDSQIPLLEAERTNIRKTLSAVIYVVLDLPSEVATFAGALARRSWSGATTVVDNDLYALLRSGTSEPDAVAVVCGTGINALGRRSDRVRPDGAWHPGEGSAGAGA